MNQLKKFEEYVAKKFVKKTTPNSLRAKDLIEEAERDLEFLKELMKKIELNDKRANNFINQAYDIIMKLLRAKLLIDGFKASGLAAHEAEVAYLAKLGFSEKDSTFLDTLRYSRNGISYYGKKFDADYAKEVLDFLDIIYPKLRSIALKGKINEG